MDDVTPFMRERLAKLDELASEGIDPFPSTFPVSHLIGDVIGVLIVVMVVLTSAIILIWLERKVAARLQDRFGP